MAQDIFSEARVLAQLDRLGIDTSELLEGFLKGVHRSAAKGASTEFSEHRAYVPGDALARLDWRAYARTDRLYVKQYADETNVDVTIVLDESASMAYPADRAKSVRARQLAATLACIAHRQRDAVGLAVLDGDLRAHLPARTTSTHLLNLLTRIGAVHSGDDTDLSTGLRRVAALARRRSVVVIISDFIASLPPTIAGLAALRERGCAVFAAHVIDSEERLFRHSGRVAFIDPESPTKKRRLDALHVARAYRRNVEQHIDDLRTSCAALGVRYGGVDTSASLTRSLAEVLRPNSDRRRRLS